MSSNDNDHPSAPLLAHASDSHGQAALMLVESLIHGLVAQSVLTTVDAVEIIESAKDIQAEVAEAAEGAGATSWQSHSLLSSIAESLKLDIGAPDSS